MKTPRYWKNRNITSDLLLPLGHLYNCATRLRLKFKPSKKVDIPVICIGNLTAGGTGKTPVAVSVAALLQQQGKKPFFVSRGYGGTLKNIIVNAQKHPPRQCGDEPLLLARQAPVVVNPDRYAGALTALQSGAELIIMDDGFQNPGLYKDLSFLVFDGSFGLGNGRCIPAGPLREDLISGLKRADAAIIIGTDHFDLHKKLDIPCFTASVKPVPLNIKNPHIIAFAGIGRPSKFYRSLRETGFNLLKTFDFPDHHYYTEKELFELIGEAEKLGADIYTTSKDFVKIPSELQNRFKVLEIAICWEDSQALANFILKRI